MGDTEIVRVIGGSQDKGVNTFEPDIGTEITWDENVVNVSTGVRRGVAPRAGMAPLPGHADTETPASGNTNGLMKSETGSGSNGLVNRELVFGCVPVVISAYDGAYPKAREQYYVWLVGLDHSSDVILDACIGSTVASSVYKQSSDLRAGLAASSYREESPLVRKHKTELLNLPLTGTPTAADMKTIMTLPASKYWLPYAHISVSGKRVPYQWMIGAVTGGTADATHAPSTNLWAWSIASGTSPTLLGGAPSETEMRAGTDNDQRTVTFYALTVNGYKLDLGYTVAITHGQTGSVPAYAGNATGAHYFSLSSATKFGASTSYASIDGVLINDPGSFTNSQHEAILVAAGEKALAAVYQDWLKAVKGMMPQWVDLTTIGCSPRAGISTTSEDGFNAKSSASPDSSDIIIIRDASAGGVLAAGTRYDFGFSYYNKKLDFETNVAYAVTLTTPAFDSTHADYTYALGVNVLSGGGVLSSYQNMVVNGVEAIPWEFSDSTAVSGGSTGRGMHVNDYELRVYYRENGTTEWLPGGAVDMAKYWFFYNWPGPDYPVSDPTPEFCTGPVASLPGGQPNGFIDYSPLPKQRYISTLVFKQRAFWWSEKSMHFSLTNNIYAYPTRNIVAAQAGSWRGGIVHTKLGEGQATASRLVVFASDRSYAAAFTGSKATQNVRVSADTVGQFEIDGSDFEMDYLSDSTAWSYRAAVVADGTLYWWGEQGIMEDDGISTPEKISKALEPDIAQFVDTTRIDEIHAVFNKSTKEVVWFYPPRVADSSFPTYGLALNIETGKFTKWKFRCQVDASQNIKIQRDSTPQALSGDRVMLHCRETTASTISRSFFFDDLCKAGEQGPAREMVVKTITTPSTGLRRFTVASGGVGLAGVSVGDYIAIPSAKDYATSMTNSSDIVAKVAAVNSGAGTVDITLPSGASLDTAALTDNHLFFPIYHRTAAAAGSHGITYSMPTNYWLGGSIADSWHWLHIYMLFKYTAWKAPAGASMTIAYRSLKSTGYVSDTITLENNSDGHCQRLHNLRPEDASESGAISGQALKYRLSGIHIGHQWTLEYLEAHVIPEAGNTLKEFQRDA